MKDDTRNPFCQQREGPTSLRHSDVDGGRLKKMKINSTIDTSACRDKTATVDLDDINQ